MDIKSILTKEGILVAAVPVVGFILALAFEYGYASHFGYPLSLVVIDLRMTVTSTIFAGFYLYFVVATLRFLYAEMGRIPYLGKIIDAVRPWIVMGFLIMFISGFHHALIWPTLIYIAAIIILMSLFWCYEAIKHGPDEALKKVDIGLSSRPVDKNDIMERIKTDSMFIIVVLSIVSGAGRLYAVNKAEYAFFTIDAQSYAIAAIYGDSVVGVAFTDGVFKEQFAVVEKGDDTLRNLGVIKIKPPKEPNQEP